MLALVTGCVSVSSMLLYFYQTFLDISNFLPSKSRKLCLSSWGNWLMVSVFKFAISASTFKTSIANSASKRYPHLLAF